MTILGTKLTPEEEKLRRKLDDARRAKAFEKSKQNVTFTGLPAHKSGPAKTKPARKSGPQKNNTNEYNNVVGENVVLFEWDPKSKLKF